MSTVYVTTAGSPVTETVFASGTAAIESSSVAPNGSTVYQTIPATRLFSLVPVSKVTSGGGIDGQSSLLAILS